MKTLKIIYSIIFFLIMLFPSIGYCQMHKVRIQNTIYAELFGSSMTYGINYQRTINSKNHKRRPFVRLGFSQVLDDYYPTRSHFIIEGGIEFGESRSRFRLGTGASVSICSIIPEFTRGIEHYFAESFLFLSTYYVLKGYNEVYYSAGISTTVGETGIGVLPFPVPGVSLGYSF